MKIEAWGDQCVCVGGTFIFIPLGAKCKWTVGAERSGKCQKPKVFSQPFSNMSFNRLSYDDCTYMHNLKQSIGVGHHVLDGNSSRCEPCFPDDPRAQLGEGNAVGVCANTPLIDVDSELMGLTRRASKCPEKQYLPKKDGYCVLKSPVSCRSEYTSEDTRLTNPPCTLRGTGINRWEWLCQNPQEDIQVPFETLINNRLIVKDNHRPCLPHLMDQSLALPPTCELDENKNDWNACGDVYDIHPMIHWRSAEEVSKY